MQTEYIGNDGARKTFDSNLNTLNGYGSQEYGQIMPLCYAALATYNFTQHWVSPKIKGINAEPRQ